MKKLLSVLLSFVMLLSLAPLTLASEEIDEPAETVEEPVMEENEAEPAEKPIEEAPEEEPAKEEPDEEPAQDGESSGKCGDNVIWRLEDGVLTITGTGEMQDFSIVGSPWYSYPYRSTIKSAVIQPGVTSIGNYAFEGCTNLTSVTIPDSVTRIGYEAFYSCSSLTSLTIGSGVTEIGGEAFVYCWSLTSVTIPDSVTTIGTNAFKWCKNLTAINVTSGNKNYASQNGVLFDKEMTTLICCPAGKTGVYAIPDGVTEIGNYAFNYCEKLTGVTIPDSVTETGRYAFAYCTSLTSVTIGNGVTTIGDYAFNNCTSLTDVYYAGTKAEWASVYYYEADDPLLGATIHCADGDIAPGEKSETPTDEPQVPFDADDAGKDSAGQNGSAQNVGNTGNNNRSNESPKTGDESSIALWMGILVLCSAAASVVFLRRKDTMTPR